MSILKRLVYILGIIGLLAFVKEYNEQISTNKETGQIVFTAEVEKEFPLVVETAKPDPNWRGYPEEKKKQLSNLGKILFFNEPIPRRLGQKNYTILVWKYGPNIEQRHIYHFTKTKHDPFAKCSIKNCHLTYNNEDLSNADLVIIHLHRTKGVQDLPPQITRKKSQIWAFLTDESPYHTFLSSKNKLEDFNGIFNWSMTYRMDSDIPVPYGRTVLRNTTSKVDIVQEFMEWKHKKRRHLAIMGSNCGSKNHRWEYVKELEKHISVDTYGNCGKLKCGGHFNTDCTKLNDYMFYLAFENSNCDEYITEKLWWNAYHKRAIPIVMGASKDSYRRLLPPESYLNIDDFANPKALADYLVYLNRSDTDLFKLFQWMKNYEIRNEHGYFQSESYHYCRVCEALNYNEKTEKIYKDLKDFWSPQQCSPRWDE